MPPMMPIVFFLDINPLVPLFYMYGEIGADLFANHALDAILLSRCFHVVITFFVHLMLRWFKNILGTHVHAQGTVFA